MKTMWSLNIIIIIIIHFLSQTYCKDVLIFGDPKDSSSQSLKIGNINDDTYEVFFEDIEASFPVGQDLTICYRWFFDQLRFTDPGKISIHLKFYRNSTDKEGIDETLVVGTRGMPGISSQEKLVVISPLTPNWMEKYYNAPWYNNLMLDLGTNLRNYRPQIWRSFCHMIDWGNREQVVVVNGVKLFREPLGENAGYFLDDDEDWPQAKLIKITFGPKLNQFTSGKTVGTFTDLNIFSENIGEEKANALTGFEYHLISCMNLSYKMISLRNDVVSSVFVSFHFSRIR